MSNKYYYLISSLPYLEFDKPPTIDREWLLDEAKKGLTDKDFNIFKSVDVNNLSMLSSDTDIIKEQKAFWVLFSQKKVLKEIITMSDVFITNQEAYAEILMHLQKNKRKLVEVLPVFSNIGELHSSTAFKD